MSPAAKCGLSRVGPCHHSVRRCPPPPRRAGVNGRPGRRLGQADRGQHLADQRGRQAGSDHHARELPARDGRRPARGEASVEARVRPLRVPLRARPEVDGMGGRVARRPEGITCSHCQRWRGLLLSWPCAPGPRAAAAPRRCARAGALLGLLVYLSFRSPPPCRARRRAAPPTARPGSSSRGTGKPRPTSRPPTGPLPRQPAPALTPAVHAGRARPPIPPVLRSRDVRDGLASRPIRRTSSAESARSLASRAARHRPAARRVRPPGHVGGRQELRGRPIASG